MTSQKASSELELLAEHNLPGAPPNLDDLNPEEVKRLARQLHARLAKAEARNAELTHKGLLLDQILASTTDHTYIFDAQLRFVYASQSGAEALGRDTQELIGKTWRELGFPERVMLAYERQVHQVMRTGEPIRGKIDFPTTKGERHYEYIINPLRDPSGTVKYVLNISRDVTERVQAEKALRESERLFRQTFEAIPAPTFLWERRPDGQFIMRMVNAAAREMSEGKIVDFLGATAQTFFENAPDVVVNIEQAFETGKPLRVELPIRMRTTEEDKWLIADYAKVPGDYVVNMIRDITERVKAEQALRVNETILSQAEKLAQLGSWEWDLREDKIKLSTQWQRIHGCSASELTTATLMPIAHPDDRPKIQRALEQALESGEPYDVEHRIIRQDDGQIRFIKAYGEVVRYGNEPIKIYGAAQDITEWVRAKEALRKSEANLSALIENTDSSIWSVDTDYRLIVSNSVFRQNIANAFGRKIVPGENALLDSLSPSIREQWKAYYDRALGGERFGVELERSFSKQRRWIEYRFSPILIDGQVTGATIVGQDVTERVQAAKALRASEERYRTVVDNSLAGIFIVQNGRFAFVNPRMVQIVDYECAEDIIGRPFWELVHPDDRERVKERGTRRERGEVQPEHYDFRGLKRDGSGVWVEIRVTLAQYQGEPALVGNIIDVTERREAEQQLRATLAEKEVLLKEIHHRVKNNLAVVSSLLEFQAETLQDQQARAALGESQNRIHAMARIHEHLYRSQDLAQIDMAPYLQSLLEQLHQSYSLYPVTLSLESADVELDIDTAIPCGLIVNELVSNALKHAFPAATMAEEKKEIRVALQQRGDQCLLVVRDNGVGFPPHLDLDATESLGLKLVTLFVRQLNGEIALEQVGGTTFKITFAGPRV